LLRKQTWPKGHNSWPVLATVVRS